MPPQQKSTFLCFDPRDPTQKLHDRSTWKRTDNAILISATMLHAVHGEKHPVSWEKVAILADLCENPDLLPAVEEPALPTLEETNAMLHDALTRRPARGLRAIMLRMPRPGVAKRRAGVKRSRARTAPANRRVT